MTQHTLRHCLTISAILFLSIPVYSQAAAPINFYVSPEGSDQFTGTVAHNNRQHTDGPFATIQRARDAARSMIQLAGANHSPVNINIRGGTYWLIDPLILTPADSGTDQAPVTYQAYGSEKPVISAGRPVRGWAQSTFNGHNVWSAKLPQYAGSGQAFSEMWVGGQRRVLARAPNHGYFHVDEDIGVAKDTPDDQGQNSFKFKNQDLKNWSDVTNATVVVMSKWYDSHLPVASVDTDKHIVHFTRSTVRKMSADDPFWVEGVAAFLNEAGEWYFDQKTTTLYYMPMPGETMLGSEAVVPWHQQIVRFQGDAANGAFIEYIVFKGLTFSHSEWELPKDPPAAATNPTDRLTASGSVQAAVGVPGAVWCNGMRNCTFDTCTISHAGNYGIELAGGCQNNKIQYCTVRDTGAGGIKIGQTSIQLADAQQTRNNQVTDSTLSEGGLRFPSAVGVWIGQSPGNLLSHNDIHGYYYTGISIGWTWGYGDTLASGNIVEFNHVHHIGTPADGVDPILSDMGGIYTLGVQPGSIIRNNVFHNVAGLRYGGWGIYLDEGASNFLVENNLVFHTTHGGFHQHYGKNNIVRNNIFALGRESQIRRSQVENPEVNLTFEHNIVFWKVGELLTGIWPDKVAFDHNIYWHAGGDEDVNFSKQTWQQWRAGGLDPHSQFANPGFVDPQQGDYTMNPNAASALPDFVPFDFKAVGPRPHTP